MYCFGYRRYRRGQKRRTAATFRAPTILRGGLAVVVRIMGAVGSMRFMGFMSGVIVRF